MTKFLVLALAATVTFSALPAMAAPIQHPALDLRTQCADPAFHRMHKPLCLKATGAERTTGSPLKGIDVKLGK